MSNIAHYAERMKNFRNVHMLFKIYRKSFVLSLVTNRKQGHGVKMCLYLWLFHCVLIASNTGENVKIVKKKNKPTWGGTLPSTGCLLRLSRRIREWSEALAWPCATPTEVKKLMCFSVSSHQTGVTYCPAKDEFVAGLPLCSGKDKKMSWKFNGQRGSGLWIM